MNFEPISLQTGSDISLMFEASTLKYDIYSI